MTVAITSGETFQRLIALANAAGLDQRRWAWFLDAFAQATGAARIQIVSVDPCARTELVCVASRNCAPPASGAGQTVSGAGLEEFQVSTLPVGLAVTLPRHPGSDAGEPAVRAEARPERHSIVAVLERHAGRTTLIRATVDCRDHGRGAADLLALLQALVPVLQHALVVSRTLGTTAIENRVLRDGMDPGVVAVLALDRGMKMHWGNARASAMIDRGGVLETGSGARLRLTDPRASRDLSRAVRDWTMPELSVSLPFLLRGPGQRRFMCRTTPISVADGPLPWLATTADRETDFVLLMIAPFAARKAAAPRQTSRG